MSKKVGIILINYKDYARRFLSDCRDSLRAQNFSAENFKVYLIDNASSEETVEYLKENYPEAMVIPRPDGNYAAGNNAGIAVARADGAEIFVIANMDTVFDKNWLPELVAALESDEKIGVAQSKILIWPENPPRPRQGRPVGDGTPPREGIINCLGNSLHYLGFGFSAGNGEADREIKGLPEIKGYASGCSLAVKKEVLDKIGGYNEEYYMYHDDLELGWRAKLAGYKIVLAPESVVYHKYEFSRSVKKIYNMERNRFIAIFSFYELTTILAILPALIIMEFGQLFFALYRGWLLEKLKAYEYFLHPAAWDKIMAERQRIKSFRVKNDKEMVDDFVSVISNQEIKNPLLDKIANPFFDWYWKFAKRANK